MNSLIFWALVTKSNIVYILPPLWSTIYIWWLNLFSQHLWQVFQVWLFSMTFKENPQFFGIIPLSIASFQIKKFLCSSWDIPTLLKELILGFYLQGLRKCPLLCHQMQCWLFRWWYFNPYKLLNKPEIRWRSSSFNTLK